MCALLTLKISTKKKQEYLNETINNTFTRGSLNGFHIITFNILSFSIPWWYQCIVQLIRFIIPFAFDFFSISCYPLITYYHSMYDALYRQSKKKISWPCKLYFHKNLKSTIYKITFFSNFISAFISLTLKIF